MSDPRTPGLIMMALACAAFVGSSSEILPAATFFPALGLFLLGAIKFVKVNGAEMAKSEKRTERRVNPTLRQNQHSQAHAERLAAKRGAALTSLGDADAEEAARQDSGRMPVANVAPGGDAIDLDESASDFVVTTDVSFPVEVQSGDALADQLRKLNELMGQGVLTEEEYAVAKAKLLG